MHSEGSLTVLGWHEVSQVLRGREAELMDLIRHAYIAHQCGKSSLPQSVFLRFPASSADRIIALPAYLNCGEEITGLKWVASFPGNLGRGVDRASAVIILNSVETGRPRSILEASGINAKRTAASAAVAVKAIHGGVTDGIVALIGCGLINFETLKFLTAADSDISKLLLYDAAPERARAFRERALAHGLARQVDIASDASEALAGARVISIATTAAKPHLDDLSMCQPGATICHISLRDITPEAIAACDNTTDDIAHVCRENTSLQLAEQLTGGRSCIRGTIGSILSGRIAPRRSEDSISVFSPFGLGILDVAVAHWAVKEAAAQSVGMSVGSFLPNGFSW
jgi:2,3-diaminopropionate biosynthesis protein SbnB